MRDDKPDHNPPRPYDLGDPADIDRLHREVAGYMRVCRACGTDIGGRAFALAALEAINKRARSSIKEQS